MGLWFGFAIACVILDIGFYVIIRGGFKYRETIQATVPPSPEGRRLAYQINEKQEAIDKANKVRSPKPDLPFNPSLNTSAANWNSSSTEGVEHEE